MRKLLLFLVTLLLGGVAWLVYEEMRRSAPAGPSPPRREPPRGPRSEPSSEGPRQGPTEVPARCVATTRSGKRCSREAESGSDLCWQHGG